MRFDYIKADGKTVTQDTLEFSREDKLKAISREIALLNALKSGELTP